jgi:putative ABC transport system permease protein
MSYINLKIVIRNLWRRKTFSALSILGLATGLAVFMLIMLWVKNEMSYDKFHNDNDRIAEIMTTKTFKTGEKQTFPAVPPPIAAAIQKDLPGVEYAATVSWGDVRQFTSGENNFMEEGLYVQPSFLKIFSFPLIYGDAVTALAEPHTVLLTQKLATKYFGNENPVGKTIMVEQSMEYKITGVLKDVPDNSTMRFNFLMPMKDYVDFAMNGEEKWENNNIRAYVKLKHGINRTQFEKEFAGILPRYTNQQEGSSLFLFKIKDWYLRNDFKDGKYAGGGRITYVKLFSVIAFFILLLACINFMNLSTARATQRAKEVGVRKVTGAGRGQLIKQFISESLFFTALAGMIAVALVWLILPYFNNFLRKNIEVDYTNISTSGVFISIIIVTGLLAGSYPAFVLSSFRPVKVLKSVLIPSSSYTLSVRKVLVVTQFAVSVMLIAGTLVISQQVHYVQNKKLGYSKENLLWFSNNITTDKHEAAINELKKVPGVINASQASVTFTYANNRSENVQWPGKTEGQDVFFNFIAGGNELVQTMGLQIKEGRDFIAGNKADTNSVLINEEAVKRMGLQNPVGVQIELYSGKVTIAGVVKDFHSESLHNPIAPTIIQCRPDWTWLMYVRTDGKNTAQTLNNIEKVYKSFAPGLVFDYNFQDKEYERLYRSESQIGTLVNWFAFFAIFISCLGLLGLTAFTVERKAKEFGIRKVLGASVTKIVLLSSKQFILLVLIAVIIAVIPAYFFMKDWLQQYAYRVNLDWWIFMIAGAMAVLIAIITISFHAIKAALANPVKSLRTE